MYDSDVADEKNLADGICVVLVAARNPLNIGAAARAMSNFGARDLRVVNPYEVAFRQARSAVGASAVLGAAKEFASVAAAVADCGLVVGTTAAGAQRELQHELKTLAAGAKEMRARSNKERVAILFGSEKKGLTNEDFSHCHWLLRIPTREQHRSMNLGQAVAVCLYELVRAERQGAKAATEAAASGAEVERIHQVLMEGLRECGYLKPGTHAVADEKMRRMLRRLKISSRDAKVLTGMLRQMVWKMRGG